MHTVNGSTEGETLPWRKASYCGEGGCVEVALSRDVIGVRDSKRSDSPVLAFTREEWVAFVAGVKNGEFDLH